MTEELLNDESFVITSDDVLGKSVIDEQGDSIGIITQLHIDKTNKNILGISIDPGFLKPQVFVGVRLISLFGIDAVYISKTPQSRYIGLIVFDRTGVIIGKVIGSEYQDKALKTLEVRTGLFRKVSIGKDKIQRIKRNVILNVKKDEI